MFKPVVGALGVCVLGLPLTVNAAYTSGQCVRYYSSCTDWNSSYKSTNEGYCGCTEVTAYNSSCSTLTCYSGCKNVCASSLYPYSIPPLNGYLSGSSCTGYTFVDADGSCLGTSATYYSDYECITGYCKSSAIGVVLPKADIIIDDRLPIGGICEKAYTTCALAGYSSSKTGTNCSAVTVYKPSCTTMTCWNCTGSSSGGSNCCDRGYTYDCTSLGGTCSNTTSSYNGVMCDQCTLSVNCCNQGYTYDCTNAGGGCSNTVSSYNGKLCIQCRIEDCCALGYKYDCRRIGGGCSDLNYFDGQTCLACGLNIKDPIVGPLL